MLIVQSERAAIGSHSLRADTRLTLWPQVLAYIGERPFTGYGFGRGLLREELQAKLSSIDSHLWHAHNLFLETLLQSGFPGLGLLLVVLGSTAAIGWRYARSADDFSAACGMALLAVLAGMLARNMTDSLFVRQNALLYWSVVAVLLAWGSLTRRG
jgi:putative inorganic carbon (HCO3(-)) transporter